MKQCGQCGRLKDTPNFAYHVCVPPKQSGKNVTMLLGAISSAIHFDKTTQYVTSDGSAVIMSARRYRELINEETPNTPIDGIPQLEIEND